MHAACSTRLAAILRLKTKARLIALLRTRAIGGCFKDAAGSIIAIAR